MMSGDRISIPATAGVGPFDDVRQWSVMLYEIEIRGRDSVELMSQVVVYGYCLEEDLWHRDRGAAVDIDSPSVHLSDECREKAKIMMTTVAKGRAVSIWMKMPDIGAYGDVRRNR